jgi:septal ring factor EnvC (AmiA/AmiB activator)
MRYIVTLILFLSMLCGASAQNVKSQKDKKERLEREIAILDKQLSANASKSSAMLSNLTLIRKKISNRRSLVSESDKEIRKYSDQIYLKQRSINRLKAKVDTLSAHYSRLVMGAYKNRDPRRWYMYILASENLGQAFRRMAYFKNLATQMNLEAVKLKEAQAELESQRQELIALKKEAQGVKKQRVEELNKLSKEEKQASTIVANLKKDKKKYQKQLAAKKKQVEALNREIERLVTSAMKGGKATSSGSKNKMVVDTKLDAEFAKNKGKLPWPADGPIVDRFGEKYHPVYKSVKLPSNNGVDIALSHGTKVCAVFDGVVRQIVVMPGYNKCVLVQHGSHFTFYCKMGNVAVKAGDKVSMGESLGTVDTINGQTLLHFQVWQNNKPQNPEYWLK